MPKGDPEKNRLHLIKWRENHREHLREYGQRYRATHKEQTALAKRRHYLANQAKISASQKEYWKLYRIRRRDHLRAYRASLDWSKYYNPEKNRIQLRAYRATEQGRLANRNAEHRRRQLIRSQPTDITPRWLRELSEKTTHCILCGKKMESHGRWPDGRHLDHIVPLVAGGRHVRSNVQFICASCNLKKARRGYPKKKRPPQTSVGVSEVRALESGPMKDARGLPPGSLGILPSQSGPASHTP